jgi:hypothetical protein
MSRITDLKIVTLDHTFPGIHTAALTRQRDESLYLLVLLRILRYLADPSGHLTLLTFGNRHDISLRTYHQLVAHALSSGNAPWLATLVAIYCSQPPSSPAPQPLLAPPHIRIKGDFCDNSRATCKHSLIRHISLAVHKRRIRALPPSLCCISYFFCDSWTARNRLTLVTVSDASSNDVTARRGCMQVVVTTIERYTGFGRA